MARGTLFHVVAIATICALVQVPQTHSWGMDMFGGGGFGQGQGQAQHQDHSQVLPNQGQGQQQGHEHGHHKHGHGHGNWFGGFNMPAMGGLQTLAQMGGYDLKGLKSKFQMFGQGMHGMQGMHQLKGAGGAILNAIMPHLKINRTSSVKAFYDNCGKSIRVCQWKPEAVNNKQTQDPDMPETDMPQPPQQQPKMKYVCLNTKHICVGNTETCITERNCDVGMKITEISKEGTNKPVVTSIAYINNCHMESQSATDGNLPQMFAGIGFATYDQSGQKLECRAPQASDFKLVFLWKNMTGGRSGPGSCTTPSDFDWTTVKLHDHELLKNAYMWAHVCKSVPSREGGFNLKTFLEKHIPISTYTSYFNPPYDFADKIDTQLHSNGMVVTGTVNA